MSEGGKAGGREGERQAVGLGRRDGDGGATTQITQEHKQTQPTPKFAGKERGRRFQRGRRGTVLFCS